MRGDAGVSRLGVFFFLMIRRPPRSTLFPTRRSSDLGGDRRADRPVQPSALPGGRGRGGRARQALRDRKSTRLNSSHANISYAVFCLKKKKPSCTRPLKPRPSEIAVTHPTTPATPLRA